MPSYETEGHPIFNRLVTMDHYRNEYVDQLKTMEIVKKNDKHERSKSSADKRATIKSDEKRVNVERNGREDKRSSNKTKKNV